MSERYRPDGRPDLLVVDSLALYRELAAHHLSRLGTVRTAGNAAAASAAIALRRPQLAVIALDLPDRSAEELVRELRENPRTSWIPVVAITRGSPAEHARAVRAGASDVLTRPHAQTLLVETVQRFLSAPLPPQGLPRLELEGPVRLWDVAHSAAGTLRNVSRGGCFVESREWLPNEGHELHLDFTLPGLSEGLALTAQLVWRRLVPARGARGAGLRFLELDGETSRALAHYVEASQVRVGRRAAPVGGAP